jgi:hypothetical protein
MVLWEIAQWRSRTRKLKDRSRPNYHDGSDAITTDILIGAPHMMNRIGLIYILSASLLFSQERLADQSLGV